jgi:molybdate transport system permease protein
VLEATEPGLPPPSTGDGFFRKGGPGRIPLALAAVSLIPVAFLALPVAALVWRSVTTGHWLEAVAGPMVGRALALTLTTTLTSLVVTVLLGTPLAYLLARYRFPGRRMLEMLVDLPMVLPPAVAGLALLMAFGRRGLLGGFLESTGIDLAFTTAAVVFAQCFVSAPLYIRAARAGFADIDPELEEIAETLGASKLGVFRHVTVPLAFPGLFCGAVMAWARALGEFGATIMFAGNFPGRTQTMPLAVYTALESELSEALALAVLLLALSTVVLAILSAAGRWFRD